MARDARNPPAERTPPVKASFRSGDIIDGKYRVERVLGQGGMGVVVAARHVRLGERVAIKFPLARLGLRTDLTSRLFREGRAAMRIRSEHVARVHDVSTLATGEPYLVMEYLDGRDLDAVITDIGPLPIDAAIEYVLQASEALAVAEWDTARATALLAGEGGGDLHAKARTRLITFLANLRARLSSPAAEAALRRSLAEEWKGTVG
ncbi:MAG: protein kinase, partial [Byssovorax sp.]